MSSSFSSMRKREKLSLVTLCREGLLVFVTLQDVCMCMHYVNINCVLLWGFLEKIKSLYWNKRIKRQKLVCFQSLECHCATVPKLGLMNSNMWWETSSDSSFRPYFQFFDRSPLWTTSFYVRYTLWWWSGRTLIPAAAEFHTNMKHNQNFTKNIQAEELLRVASCHSLFFYNRTAEI